MTTYAPLNVIDTENFSQNIDFTVRNVGNYNVIKYKKEKLNNNNVKTLGQLRSVITDGTNILCMAPPKSVYFDQFVNSEMNIKKYLGLNYYKIEDYNDFKIYKQIKKVDSKDYCDLLNNFNEKN